MLKILFYAMTVSFLLGVTQTHALTLNEYLDQVRSSNKGLSGVQKQAEAASDKMAEANLLFRPSFFAEGVTASDGKQSNPAFLRYDRIEADKYSVGLSVNLNCERKNRHPLMLKSEIALFLKAWFQKMKLKITTPEIFSAVFKTFFMTDASHGLELSTKDCTRESSRKICFGKFKEPSV